MAKKPANLYMVIDTTCIEATKIRAVADINRATRIGQIYMAEHPGRTCIAAPLEARGFTKLDLLALQYLLWNNWQIKPPEVYADLVQLCLKQALTIEVDASEMAQLEAEYTMSKKDEAKVIANLEPKAPKAPKAPSNATPKKMSTCGVVWDICGEVKAASGLSLDDKALRGLIMAACEKEGINKSTSNVQYGKWKASLSGQVTA